MIKKLTIVLLLLAIAFVGVQAQDVDECDPQAQQIADNPETGYSRMAVWMTRQLYEEGQSISTVQVSGQILEYALLSQNCFVIEYVFRTISDFDRDSILIQGFHR